jgi:hypothetical protein
VSERFPCPYLGGEVELTGERAQHVLGRHDELWPAHRAAVAETLADPDAVYRSHRSPGAREFVRWYDTLQGVSTRGRGKFVMVVVVSDTAPPRHWLVTAYVARRLPLGGVVEWTRS